LAVVTGIPMEHWIEAEDVLTAIEVLKEKNGVK
jgi:hypothetical protein